MGILYRHTGKHTCSVHVRDRDVGSATGLGRRCRSAPELLLWSNDSALPHLKLCDACRDGATDGSKRTSVYQVADTIYVFLGPITLKQLSDPSTDVRVLRAND